MGGKGGAGESVQGEEEDKVVLEEDTVRGEEIKCRKETKNERSICEEDTIFRVFFLTLPPHQ